MESRRLCLLSVTCVVIFELGVLHMPGEILVFGVVYMFEGLRLTLGLVLCLSAYWVVWGLMRAGPVIGPLVGFVYFLGALNAIWLGYLLARKYKMRERIGY